MRLAIRFKQGAASERQAFLFEAARAERRVA
jgi:hypothetical protein